MNAEWRQKIRRAADRIDALSPRERALIFVGILVVPIVIAVNFLFAPLRAEQLRLEAHITGRLHQASALDTAGDVLLKSRTGRPDAAVRAQIAQLQQRLRTDHDKLTAMTRGLVDPREMAGLVRAMLAKNGRLQLVSIENLPPLALTRTGTATGKSNTVPMPAVGSPVVSAVPGDTYPGVPVVYLHGMKVVLKGRYIDIVRYLQALQGLRWKMFWGSLRLKSEYYPVSEVTLVIYTLGFNRAWIGM